MDILIVKKPLQKRSYATVPILCIVGVSNKKHACMREQWFSTVLVCLLIVTVGSFSLSPFLVSHAEAAEESWKTKASRISSLLLCREKREAEGS